MLFSPEGQYAIRPQPFGQRDHRAPAAGEQPHVFDQLAQGVDLRAGELEGLADGILASGYDVLVDATFLARPVWPPATLAVGRGDTGLARLRG